MLTFLILIFFQFVFHFQFSYPNFTLKKLQFKFQVNLLTNPCIKQIEIAKNVVLKYVSMD